MNGASWADDLIVLERIYADDTIEWPLQEACRQLSHRTKNTLSFHASIAGFASSRAVRRGYAPRARTESAPRKPRLTDEQKADREVRRQQRLGAKKADRAAAREHAKAERIAAKEHAKAERKAQRARDRQNTKAAVKRRAAEARDAARREADKAKAVAIATKAAEVAKAALAAANRLAREAGLPTMGQIGGQNIVASAPIRAQIVGQKPGQITTGERTRDHGSRDYIRRRLIYTIEVLSAELREPVAAITEAARVIAADGFPRTVVMSSAEASEMVLATAMRDSI